MSVKRQPKSLESLLAEVNRDSLCAMRDILGAFDRYVRTSSDLQRKLDFEKAERAKTVAAYRSAIEAIYKLNEVQCTRKAVRLILDRVKWELENQRVIII